MCDRTTGAVYKNFISQTMNILKPKQRLMRIYPVFHFIPGEPDAETAWRKDGKMHLLNTTPNSAIANALLDAALQTKDQTRLYRIGIATHAYADTWAHQNFVGWYDYFNNIGLDFKPDIGHADAEHHPDWPSHRWDDERLVEGAVSNSARFLEAAEKIYDKYRQALADRAPSMQWRALQANLIEAMGEPFSGSTNWYRDRRVAAYDELAPWLGAFDEETWRYEAIERDLLKRIFEGRYFWRTGIDPRDTDWYLFQESVKEHQRLAMALIEPLFKKMDVDLKVC